MEYCKLSTGEPVYFAYQDANKRRSPNTKFKFVADRYEERYGVRPKRALVNETEAAALNGAAKGVEITGRRHVPSGVYFLELP
jgi:hypothetical protein